jgi:hypothetical protein
MRASSRPDRHPQIPRMAGGGAGLIVSRHAWRGVKWNSEPAPQGLRERAQGPPAVMSPVVSNPAARVVDECVDPASRHILYSRRVCHTLTYFLWIYTWDSEGFTLTFL